MATKQESQNEATPKEIKKIAETEAKAKVKEPTPTEVGPRPEELTATSLVYQRIYNVMSAVGKVEKGGNVSYKSTNYNYQTADDIVEAVKVEMVKQKLIIIPSSVEIMEGPNEYTQRAKMEYRIICIEDQSEISIPIIGDGMDRGDKGIYKAFTGAYKYLMKQTFMIESGEDDYDKDASEKLVKEANPTPRKTKPNSKTLATGRFNNENYIKVSGTNSKTGKPYTIWKPVNQQMGDNKAVFWNDQDFTKAGGQIYDVGNDGNTKSINPNDLPF